MYEVEVKVEAPHGDVRSALAERGAEAVDSVVQVDTYYDAPHRDFAATDEALRIRREKSTAADESTKRIAYKGPLVEEASKTREEAETRVADVDAMERILDGLGFQPAATVHKNRERFALDGYTVTLDAVDDLGEFVEVETDVEREAEVPAARKGALEVLESLGLGANDGIRTSYLGLLLAEDNSQDNSPQ